ncbi:MAG: DinB family protein [Cytophagales bacterium]
MFIFAWNFNRKIPLTAPYNIEYMTINFLFESQKTYRKNIISAVEGLSFDSLHKVPTGFSNNIHWNLCHILVTQQLLVYKLAGLEMFFEQAIIDQFKKGTSVQDVKTHFELSQIEEWMKSTLEKMVSDYHQEKFKDYSPYPTSSGIVLNNVDEAILYNHVHEQLHYGYILAMRKLV